MFYYLKLCIFFFFKQKTAYDMRISDLISDVCSSDLIASLVNLFLGSTALQFAISIIGVLVFTGLTAWDTQRLKSEYAAHHDQETSTKMAVFGALSLYLNFINIFQLLLNFTGQNEIGSSRVGKEGVGQCRPR